MLGLFTALPALCISSSDAVLASIKVNLPNIYIYIYLYIYCIRVDYNPDSS